MKRRRLLILLAAGIASTDCLSNSPSPTSADTTETTVETVIDTTALPSVTDREYGDFYLCLRNDRDSEHTVRVTISRNDETVYEKQFSLSTGSKIRKQNIISQTGNYQVDVRLDGNQTRSVDWDVPENINSITGVHIVVERQRNFDIGVSERRFC